MSEEFEIGLDLFEELYKETEVLLEQATSFAQIGKVRFYTTGHVWSKTSGVREVNADEWRKTAVIPGEQSKWLNLHIEVDTQEFNPSLDRKYHRWVQVNGGPWNRKNADNTYTTIPSDWAAITAPSLEDVTGKSDYTAALNQLQGKYVKVLDVKQQPTKRQPEPEYNTAKFDTVYASREEAYADHNKLRGGTSATAETVTTTTSTPSYPADQIELVKKMYNTYGVKDIGVIAKDLNLSESDVKSILGV